MASWWAGGQHRRQGPGAANKANRWRLTNMRAPSRFACSAAWRTSARFWPTSARTERNAAQVTRVSFMLAARCRQSCTPAGLTAGQIACMHAEPLLLDGRWLATAWRWAGRWLCGGGLPMGVAHRARASAGLDQHVMAASPSVVRPLWREGRPRSVGSKLAKKKNDEALWVIKA